MNVNELVNRVKSAALSVGEMLTPVLRESRFRETGVLTPEEFVAAGDHLVHVCPTWAWATANELSKVKDFLPKERQYLVTRRVPCHQRFTQITYDLGLEKVISELTQDGELEEWVDTHHHNIPPKPPQKEGEGENESKIEEEEKKPPEIEENIQGEDDDEGGGEAMDMDAFVASGALEDEDPNRYVVVPQKKKTNKVGTPSKSGAAEKQGEIGDQENWGEDEVERTRTYDIHITYDKYYQVPRFWLVGYDEQGRLLGIDQMKEDFSQEHADRTITLEAHPHVGGLHLATIHPCRHAAVMKQLIERFADAGKELSVLDYLFVFLKFMQAVIPTVEYDYTRSIEF